MSDTRPEPTLIDEFLPTYDASERHATSVRASPDRIYAALRMADLATSPLVRLLFGLRALPLLFSAKAGATSAAVRRLRMSIRLSDFEARGFTVLAENPPRELLIGLVGSFWTAGGGLRTVDAATFRGPQAPGTARAAWNFRVEPSADGSCRLTTETRVLATDPESRRRFRWYWRVIQPGSGLIRRSMLRAIRRTAERPVP